MDAIMNYSEHEYHLVKTGETIVLDRFGNLTEPDGELTEGQVLFLKKTNP